MPEVQKLYEQDDEKPLEVQDIGYHDAFGGEARISNEWQDATVISVGVRLFYLVFLFSIMNQICTLIVIPIRSIF